MSKKRIGIGTVILFLATWYFLIRKPTNVAAAPSPKIPAPSLLSPMPVVATSQPAPQPVAPAVVLSFEAWVAAGYAPLPDTESARIMWGYEVITNHEYNRRIWAGKTPWTGQTPGTF